MRIPRSSRVIGVVLALLSYAAWATEFHVAVTGSEANDGSAAKPFRSISKAAQLAQPGDVITVHAGVYRERVNPPRGGESDMKRIVYQAAPGEKVEIKGSEVITGWVKVQDDVWKVSVYKGKFWGFNPYSDLIRGDWFWDRGRPHHTGAVYLNGEWVIEAAKLEDVLKPMGPNPLWFAQVDKEKTTLWAQFKGVNPNEQLVEINMRRTVFYPDKPGRNYITVRGFTMRHAATPWAPPTAEQVGLIGTHWSKGWIIENNVISHSACSGVSLGKYGDEFDNKSSNSAEGYVGTINRALTNGWNKETIGHHLVRNNTISHCGQAGIVGSLGAAFSQVINNTIHDIHVAQTYDGCEQAGIKFHGAIDTEIRGNHIYRAYRGLWLDWMSQGTRVTGNLFHDNSSEDIYMEVNHGPFLVDNNLLLSSRSLWDMSEGGTYAHNLLAGKIDNWYDMERLTPHLLPHATGVAGLTITQGGDNRFFNNMFIGQGLPGDAPVVSAPPKKSITGFGLWVYDARGSSLVTGGNVYYNGARPSAKETAALTLATANPAFAICEKEGGIYLQLTLGAELRQAATELVTTERLGKARVASLAYENPDGSPVRMDTDYFGKTRDPVAPSAGPFEKPGIGPLSLKVR